MTSSPTTKPRRRMAPDAREDMLLDGAVRFFAERGFNAQMRELARELGVAASLLYRYFESKDALIERVYERVFMARWRAEWEAGLRDRSQPIETRLRAFYVSYLGVIDEYEWIRVSLASSLSGRPLTKRYVEEQIEPLLEIIAVETEIAAGRAPEPLFDPSGRLSDPAYERVYHLQSSAIYYLIRKHVIGSRVAGDRRDFVDAIVRSYLDGAR